MDIDRVTAHGATAQAGDSAFRRGAAGQVMNDHLDIQSNLEKLMSVTRVTGRLRVSVNGGGVPLSVTHRGLLVVRQRTAMFLPGNASS